MFENPENSTRCSNDHAPIFSTSTFRFFVAENHTNGTDVNRTVATDDDGGPNGELDYSIAPADVPFGISSGGVLFLTEPLDYEAQRLYNFTVTAQDRGEAGLSTVGRNTSVQVSIHVLDVNDNRPVVDPTVIKVSVLEHAPVGNTVLTVDASDADSGARGEVFFRLADCDLADLVAFNTTNGTFSVKTDIDYDELNVSTLICHLRAVDRGTPELTSDLIRVVITLAPLDDNLPLFNATLYTAAVPEDIPLGSHIGQVFATDADRGDEHKAITFELVESEATTPFVINGSTGVISLIDNLDYESLRVHDFVVIALSGTNSSSTAVLINVTNINDNPPR